MTKADDETDPCKGCGVCCRAFSLPPFDANELVKAPQALLDEIEAFSQSPAFDKSSPCFWQEPDTGRCRHHDVRPTLCRWFEPGCEACEALRSKAGLKPIPTSF